MSETKLRRHISGSDKQPAKVDGSSPDLTNNRQKLTAVCQSDKRPEFGLAAVCRKISSLTAVCRALEREGRAGINKVQDNDKISDRLRPAY